MHTFYAIYFSLCIAILYPTIFDKLCFQFYLIQAQFSSVSQSFLTLQPHGLQYARLPCPSPTCRAYSNSCPSSWWCHPTISLKCFLISLKISSLTWVVSRGALFHLQVCEVFSSYLSFIDFSFYSFVFWKQPLHDFCYFKLVNGHFMTQNVVYLGKYSKWDWEKDGGSSLLLSITSS